MTPQEYIEKRKAAGITATAAVRELCAICGVSEPSAWHWVSGTEQPHRKPAAAVCRLLDAWQLLSARNQARLLKQWQAPPPAAAPRTALKWLHDERGLGFYLIQPSLAPEQFNIQEAIEKAMEQQYKEADAAIRELLKKGVPMNDIVTEFYAAGREIPLRYCCGVTKFELPTLIVRVRDKE